MKNRHGGSRFIAAFQRKKGKKKKKEPSCRRMPFPNTLSPWLFFLSFCLDLSAFDSSVIPFSLIFFRTWGYRYNFECLNCNSYKLAYCKKVCSLILGDRFFHLFPWRKRNFFTSNAYVSLFVFRFCLSIFTDKPTTMASKKEAVSFIGASERKKSKCGIGKKEICEIESFLF